MSKARDELAAEILRTVPQPRIIAAAAAMLHEEFGIVAPTVGQIADYIETLNVRGLKLLHKVALALEERTEGMH